MTEEEIEWEINKIEQQLKVIINYPEDWLERFGKKGFQEEIDNRLERLKKLYKLLKK